MLSVNPEEKKGGRDEGYVRWTHSLNGKLGCVKDHCGPFADGVFVGGDPRTHWDRSICWDFKILRI